MILILLASFLGIALGGYILVTRLDPLNIGDYRFSYVAFWVSLGSGCMVGGVFALDDGLSYAYVAQLVAAASYLGYQYRAGQVWQPPVHASTDHGQLEEVQHDTR